MLQVGPNYGRKMMGGFLKAHGFKVSEQRIGEALCRVDPVHHTIRRNLARRSINPTFYKADYFGQKLHVDQNEKIVMYGATHVCAVPLMGSVAKLSPSFLCRSNPTRLYTINYTGIYYS